MKRRILTWMGLSGCLVVALATGYYSFFGLLSYRSCTQTIWFACGTKFISLENLVIGMTVIVALISLILSVRCIKALRLPAGTAWPLWVRAAAAVGFVLPFFLELSFLRPFRLGLVGQLVSIPPLIVFCVASVKPKTSHASAAR